MRLIERANKEELYLREIPSKWGTSSNYFIVAIVEDNGEIYVAFTDRENEELWIEKYKGSKLKTNFMSFDDLVKIEDNKEFQAILIFLTKEKVLK